MTYDSTKHETTPEQPAAADESFGWSEPQEQPARGTQAREWMTQLQTMIEQLAEQAAPVVREVGAKAAELAAIAGEKAGPFAQRAAEFTADAGMKIAERSREFATELRRDQKADEPVETEDKTPASVS